MHCNGGDGVCGVVRVGNADVPVLALVRADGVDVAAKDEQAVRVRAFQNIRAEVCGVALRDAAEVDFRAGVKGDGVAVFVNVRGADGLERGVDLALRGELLVVGADAPEVG